MFVTFCCFWFCVCWCLVLWFGCLFVDPDTLSQPVFWPLGLPETTGKVALSVTFTTMEAVCFGYCKWYCIVTCFSLTNNITMVNIYLPWPRVAQLCLLFWDNTIIQNYIIIAIRVVEKGGECGYNMPYIAMHGYIPPPTNMEADQAPFLQEHGLPGAYVPLPWLFHIYIYILA